MEFLRTWVLTVTACAMIVALADGLMPAGGVRKVGKLTGGLVLMLGILQPIVTLDWENLDLSTLDLPTMAAETTYENTEKEGELLKSIIEEELGAYVWDKAASLGASIEVTVTCEIGEDGLPCPGSAVLRGHLTPGQRTALGRVLREDLEIPDQCQTFLEEGGT